MSRNMCYCGKMCQKAGTFICSDCRKDPKKLSKARWHRDKQKMQQNIDEAAERETASLPREDAYTPMCGERIIQMMLRGDIR